MEVFHIVKRVNCKTFFTFSIQICLWKSMKSTHQCIKIECGFRAGVSTITPNTRTKDPGRVDGCCDTTLWDTISCIFVEKHNVLVYQPAHHRGCHPTGVTDLTLEANRAFLTECKKQNCIFLIFFGLKFPKF